MRSNSLRYNAVAIGLHWLIALAILANIALGAWMSGAIDDPQTQARAVTAFQWHKSIGLTVLVLSLMRLAWRILYPPPPLPANMQRLERIAALATHWVFYALMIGIPLSGWVYVSAQWRDGVPLNVPTLWFELFEVPHLFALHLSAEATRESTAGWSMEAHELLVGALLLLLVIHVAAAIRHQFIRRDGVLARMLPGALPVDNARPGKSGVGRALAVLLVAGLLIAYAISTSFQSGPTTESDIEAALQRLVPAEARLPYWQVDAEYSSIRFSGVHAGRAFNGMFPQWRAAILYNPKAPADAVITAVVKTASAADGVPMHDRTLPQREWFNSARYPFAVFRTTRINEIGENRFELHGTLTIKNHEVALAPMTAIVMGDVLTITGGITIDRAEVDMGMESDPDGRYVSREIGITVEVKARRTTY